MENIPKVQILQCTHFKSKSPGQDARVIKDYEFDFYLSGERDMQVDGKYHKISAGTLVFKKPGQFVKSHGDYDAYMLTLDFSGRLNISPDKYLRSPSSPPQEKCAHSVFDSVPASFFPEHSDEIKNLFKKIIDCSYPNITNEQLQEKLLSELLFLILHDAFKFSREKEKGNLPKTNYIENACKFINKNYSRPITLDTLSQHLSLNKNYLIRLFKKELGITPNLYILETRLFYARLLVIQTPHSVSEISDACGFNTPSYFIKCFKEKYGISPKAYKKKYGSV